MTRRQANALTFLSLSAFFFALLSGGRVPLRFDLTGDKAYTLSPVSRNLYAEIEDEVRVTYYVSGRLRASSPVPRTIEDTLGEYAASSRGRITLAVRDPDRAEQAGRAGETGIRPRQVEIMEKDGAVLATVYSGVVIEYLEKAEVISFVFSLDSLEYDVTSRIRSLIRDRERNVGIISGDSSRSRDGDYGPAAAAMIRSGFRTVWLEGGGEIPENLSALVVLGGAGELDELALYRIDRYVRGGGKALFALEGVDVDRETLEARRVRDQGLLAMIASYGAVIREALVLDRSALRAPPYPHWISIQASSGRADHPVSARFEGADLFWPSPVELAAPGGIEAVPLFTTTNGARIMDGGFVTAFDAPSLYEQDEGAGETFVMAAALSGIFPSWFDGAAEGRPSRIVVTGDADMFSSLALYTGAMERNTGFLLRSLDWLTNDDDIIVLRSRLRGGGRLDRIADPGRFSSAARFVRVLNMVLLPLGVLAVFFIISGRRRRGKYRM
ncbi:MAG: GldG family protein [Treponema sp.]|jgi:ABC-type uncharacterized transport system involved in gliding motility auxiliary subunit|nr:GldG family protein [Treponema sp.]